LETPSLIPCRISYTDRCCESAEIIDLGPWIAAIYSRHTPERQWNEDSLALIAIEPETLILIIADGAGGHSHGREASQALIREMMSLGAEDETVTKEGLGREILTRFDKANQAIRDLGGNSLSTMSLVEIHGRTFRSYHAGDSKILVIGSKGKIKYQTRNHGPLEQGIECGFLHPDDPNNIEIRHIVTNMVGGKNSTLEVSLNHKIDKNDRILVASDGLYDNIPPADIADFINGIPVTEAAEFLIEKSRSLMALADDTNTYKVDDMSFILLGPRRG
jgi:serine/threonine protein phosphatase PrpC